MKRKRLAIALGAMVLVGAFSISCYVIHLKQQTVALLAARKTPEAFERYERIQQVLKGTETEPVPEDRPISFPESAPEEAELLKPLKEAEAVFARADAELSSDAEWKALRDDLFSRPSSRWSTADWERLNAFLARHQELLAEVRAMAASTGPLYPLDISQGWATPLPHLAPTRALAQLLQASAIGLGHGGDYDGAASDLAVGFQLGARLKDEPFIISQLMNVAIDGILQDAVIEVFPEGKIPPEFQAALARQFHSTDLAQSMLRCMETERDLGVSYLAQLMDSGWQQAGPEISNLFASSAGSPNTWAGFLYASPLARPWQDLDLQAYSHIMGESQSTFEVPFYEAQPRLDQIAREVADLPFTRVFTNGMVPSVYNVHVAIAREEARQQILLLGAAVESYANEHGSYPQSLEVVEGQANGASIIDPFTGTPFHYAPNGGSFDLYSVGRDLEDDGGRQDFEDGDIVWRGNPAPARSNLVAQR